MNLNEIWTKTLAQIEVKLDSPAQFKTWFKDTKLIEVSGRYATVQVNNPYTADWLRNRHEKMICDTLSYVASKPLRLKFNVSGQISEIEHEEEAVENVTPGDDMFSLNNGIMGSIAQKITESGLNNKYTMGTYVVGPSNRFAHAAAEAVVEQPGQTYNPLFVYGPSGVGKTHLAQAVAISMLERNPNRKIVYSASEGFLNDMVKALRKGLNLEFRQKYRKIDCLIIDDIQYISNWEKTQDEMFNTFNELYNANKQIILVSDRKPEDIANIDARLRTRFLGGMTVDIQSPDFATRIAILQQKILSRGVDFPYQIVEYLAQTITTNIRELEGAIQKLSLYMNMKQDGSPLTLAEVAQIIGLQSGGKTKPVSLNQILKIIGSEFGVSAKDIKGERRTAEIAHARQITMYILRDELGYTLEKIAKLLNRKDHTTVLHGIDKVKTEMAKSDGFTDQIVRLKQQIREA